MNKLNDIQKEFSKSFCLNSSNYKFLEVYTMGVSVLPEYFEYFKKMSRGKHNKYLKYLYFKYHKRLLSIKHAPNKRTATTTYQPTTKQYKNLKLTNINPYLWDKYWDLRRITGYSISYILRMFLEWEMEFNEQIKNKKMKNIEKIYMPLGINLNFDVESQFQNSYVVKKWGRSHTNDINILFRDEFY